MTTDLLSRSHARRGLLHRIWWHHGDSLIGGRWIWRPLCWIKGGCEDYYGACVVCRRAL